MSRGFYKLLNVDRNPKTVKGQSQGWLTGVLYFAPWKSAGINVCPFAEQAGCAAGCLNTAGRGGIARGTFKPYDVELPDNQIQRARIARTRYFVDHRVDFFTALIREIRNLTRNAERKGLKPAVRLNGTSDILWEREEIGTTGCTIFDLFPEVQFYDYTKIAKRFARPLPDNYHLTLSYSEANPMYSHRCWEAYGKGGVSMVMVTRDGTAPPAITAQLDEGTPIVDGDAHDLRFLDKPGSIVVLKAKGAARRETNGFVLD